jgi:hypothetical protein
VEAEEVVANLVAVYALMGLEETSAEVTIDEAVRLQAETIPIKVPSDTVKVQVEVVGMTVEVAHRLVPRMAPCQALAVSVRKMRTDGRLRTLR